MKPKQKTPLKPTLDTIIARINQKVEACKVIRAKLIAAMPSWTPVYCDQHPNVARPVDMEQSVEASVREGGRLRIRYGMCAECRAESVEHEGHLRMMRAGVPLNMMHCTFANYRPHDGDQRDAVAIVTRFMAHNRGMLIMTGNVGTGKTHLAVAAVRARNSDSLLITQDTLIYKLRQTYRDPKAEDIVTRCMETCFLVLDEIGVSTEGRDEYPTLYRIINHRHCNKLPTMFTSNLPVEEFKEAIGLRLDDRFRESLFDVVEFTGPSNRRNQHSRYHGKD